MKKISLLILTLLITTTYSYAWGQNSTSQNESTGNPDVEAARQDYRIYAQELKKLSTQYKALTTEIGKVLKEEGIVNQNGDIVGFEKDVSPENQPQIGYTINVNKTEILVTVQMPGVHKDKTLINISDSQILNIKSVSKIDNSEINKEIKLPYSVKSDNSLARYEDGIFYITMQRLMPESENSAVKIV